MDVMTPPLAALAYAIASVLLLLWQWRVIGRLHDVSCIREAQEDSGFWPTLRRVPSSANLSTMLFSFAALIHIAYYVAILLFHRHGEPFGPYGVALFHIGRVCMLGGALASASHKMTVYKLEGPAERGHPPRPRGKGNGRGDVPVPFSLPDESDRRRDQNIHHLQVEPN